MSSMYIGNGLSAQVLPVLNSFRGRTFNGTLDVSWPMLFEDCTFVTDSVVLRHSYGAVFRNCTFESRTGTLYMAENGDGVILADCDVTGCDELRFCRIPSLTDRNYITGVRINGEECSVLDEQESIIDIDGLELSETVTEGSAGPMFMIMNADRNTLRGGETAVVSVRGLEGGMFVGWQSSDPTLELRVDGEFSCTVIAPAQVNESGTVVISAYTEYGLEAACKLTLAADEQTAVSVKKSRKKQR